MLTIMIKTMRRYRIDIIINGVISKENILKIIVLILSLKLDLKFSNGDKKIKVDKVNSSNIA